MALIREIGGGLEGPVNLEVGRLCDFAETLVNGNPLRNEELLNIMNFVYLSIQDVLRAVDDPGRRAVKIERLKKKMGAANKRLDGMRFSNSNGNHDNVVKIQW